MQTARAETVAGGTVHARRSRAAAFSAATRWACSSPRRTPSSSPSIFAYPLGFAVWMSFHDYFFAAPGAIVDRPFVGLDNYRAVLTDPAVRRAFRNIVIFLVINVPLTVVLSLVLAIALNRGDPRADVLPGRVLRPVRDGERRGGRRVAVPVQLRRPGQLGPRPAGAGPVVAGQRDLAMPIIAVFVTWKQLGFFILLYLAALQNVPKELYESASIDGAAALAAVLVGDRARRSGRRPRSW